VIDLLVAGGGPIGLATALYAQAAGLEVRVCEPRAGPIGKACGEGLMPGAVKALADLGITPAGRPFRGIRYTDGVRSAEAVFSSGAGRGVARIDLQQALRRQVIEAGIEITARTVRDIEQDERSVRAAGLTSRYLVAADGLHSAIRRSCGLREPASRPGPSRWGLRQHFAVQPWSDLVEVHWSVRSEAYITPLADRLLNVALLTRSRAPFDEQLRAFPELAERVRGAEVDTVRGAGPLRQRTSGRVAGRVLLVGDAAGYVDALTGEGIAVGLACARQLIECLRVGQPGRYERRWQQATRRYRTLTEALLWASGRPWPRRAIVPLSAAVPPLFSAVVRQLSR